MIWTFFYKVLDLLNQNYNLISYQLGSKLDNIFFQSISRQHAVINILNSYDFMLMDLDSANKTKLADVS